MELVMPSTPTHDVLNKNSLRKPIKQTELPEGQEGGAGEPGFPALFRFTFGPEFIDKLSRFAKVHQYDDRKTFKEAWAAWIKDDDVSYLINDEFKRLTNTGFKGDIMDKMFKSARYYYRKKSDTPKEPRERKEYVGFSKEILVEMDANIQAQLGSEKGVTKAVAPAKAFAHYCANYRHTIVSELTRENPEMSSWTRDEIEDMTNRFKKAYKNRFYKRGNQGSPRTPLH